MLIKIQGDQLVIVNSIPSKYIFDNVSVNEEDVTSLVSYNPTKETFEQYGFVEYPDLEQEEYITRNYELVEGEIKVVETKLSDEEIAKIEAEKQAQTEAEEEAKQRAEEAEAQAEENAKAATIANREASFNSNFFLTSLGYISKVVHMQDGTIKSFLYDLLPTIALGVQSGLEVNIITYAKPESFDEEVDYVSLQSTKVANTQFVQECMVQVSNEFKGA